MTCNNQPRLKGLSFRSDSAAQLILRGGGFAHRSSRRSDTGTDFKPLYPVRESSRSKVVKAFVKQRLILPEF
ncbi:MULTISPECIES: hypothetical protein [Cyanophyceae]|uniref:hypothetical protein n=1 Tax=Cyanophyceae TaxID=3028117 RepID=UPI00232E2A0E|nr:MULTISPECIES: hypothetical protein [Cyanophyceae]MDB9354899.1 hypothetical protein [Nodularia spumigena CS-587/03]MDB9318509.1 hypothetical protein [Nodularia spumigena CS-590/01A]MDB9321550.1 hypothetical protein [Nodularia spumigena CS-591/07A]MDB9327151.1 hypothetical protein [Nodularia spumigena CS-590/02]MDB9331152.1 hypothetical protein [Nodularia spumigena CS-591/04]